ncbi:hypothetical protein J6590_097208 [Homalodisca vitripennis]|nr:hypothetical protein J6590_097208 [Homalodisca vitripennis]
MRKLRFRSLKGANPEALLCVILLHPVAFLTDDFPTVLKDLPLNTRNNMLFMKDEAPAHFSLHVRNYLDREYKNKWIGRGGPVP